VRAATAAEHDHGGEHAGHGHEGDSHASHGHSHFQVGADTDSRRLTIALALIASFMAAEGDGELDHVPGVSAVGE